jgi:hypothetical protein
MTLPIIEVPKYELKLPVSEKKIHFRPFLVKEQKVLLQAMEMGDESQVAIVMEDLATACTFDKVDIHSLPYADVEYIILNIRKKSVSENVDLSYRCANNIDGEKCGNKILYQLNLDEVNVTIPEGKATQVMLTDEIGIKLKDLSYDDIKKARELNTAVEQGYSLIMSSIESVFDTQQVYTKNDFDEKELIEFLDNLGPEMLEKIEQSVSNIPVIEKIIKLKCNKCGNEEEITLRGLDDFLG